MQREEERRVKLKQMHWLKLTKSGGGDNNDRSNYKIDWTTLRAHEMLYCHRLVDATSMQKVTGLITASSLT